MNPVVSEALESRVERAEIETLRSRLEAVRGRVGNPMDVEIREFGDATAFVARNAPGPSFNTVKGVGAAEGERIPAIASFYRRREIPCWVEVAPTRASSDLFTALADRGFVQSQFHSALYGTPSLEEHQPPPGVTVRELTGGELDLFADVYVEGFGLSDDIRSGVAANNEVLADRAAWRFFMACVDGVPASVGVLHAKNGIESLAAAATRPNFRGRGCHTALVRRRMFVAELEGCDLVVGEARFASTSQNNIEQQGLKLAYTKSIVDVNPNRRDAMKRSEGRASRPATPRRTPPTPPFLPRPPA